MHAASDIVLNRNKCERESMCVRDLRGCLFITGICLNSLTRKYKYSAKLKA